LPLTFASSEALQANPYRSACGASYVVPTSAQVPRSQNDEVHASSSSHGCPVCARAELSERPPQACVIAAAQAAKDTSRAQYALRVTDKLGGL
jgi:hypothetical protein